MANTRERRTRQEYALLRCAEFFRDELGFGSPALASLRLEGKFEELKTLCFDALSDPSMKDADDIKARYNELRRVECSECRVTFTGLEVENIGGRDYCNACRSIRLKGRDDSGGIKF